jgi:thioredoxin reductase
MTATDVTDITVIGAGPVGLSAAFWAGMREASVQVVDALPEIGGQCTALYPDKWIYDVPGFERVQASELVERLARQAIEQFDAPVHLETTVTELAYEATADGDSLIRLVTDGGELWTRAVILAGGHGAFEPKKMPGLDLTEWEGRGVSYVVTDKRRFAGKRVVIAGGGDSACDWALNLLDTAAEITLVHRRDTFRAHEITVAQLTAASRAGRCAVLTPHEIASVYGDERLTQVRVRTVGDDGAGELIECDELLVQFGFKTALGPLKAWPLEIVKGAIAVDPLQRTSMPRVWACGDIATREGKLKLIATGFAEAAMAVAQAVHELRPDVSIQPKYSTNTGVPSAASAYV